MSPECRSSPSESASQQRLYRLRRSLTTGGAYDDLTLWEQIDGGAQYTPARKWLTSVPIGLYVNAPLRWLTPAS
jgi:hypothetical protein